MNFYLHMVNAWSLAASALNGTLDEDYPIMDKTKGRWSDDITITPRESDEYDIINPNEDDGLDYEVNYYDDYMADIDDQRAHHFVHANSAYNDGWTPVSYTHLTLPTIE